MLGRLKEDGVVQTSMDSLRSSVDGSKAILKWTGRTKPSGINDLNVVFEGTREEIRLHLKNNKKDWEPVNN
jgi:hypothetical protein